MGVGLGSVPGSHVRSSEREAWQERADSVRLEGSARAVQERSPRIDFARTPAAPGTGAATPRQQINTVPSFIDAFAVYGSTDARLEWLRKGPVNGTLSDSSPLFLLPGNYLPRENARHDVASAPAMDLMGPLVGNRANAVVAGDVRANENIALTATHTLFAREHNRIVSLLPNTLPADDRFQIARRIVGAEQQYITYNEFLPALGVQLSPYRGYDPTVNPSISNEFATVGYRVHSMVHGELEPDAPATLYRPKRIDAFQKEGVQVKHEEASVRLVIPLDLAFGNPEPPAGRRPRPSAERPQRRAPVPER